MKHLSTSLSLIIILLISMLLGSMWVNAQETFLKRFTAKEMIGLKSFSEYQEAPVLSKLVKEGKLPPVKERLPEKPVVVKTNIMADGTGEYGGIWRDTFASPIESWNFAAGQAQGWYGIDQLTQEELVKTGPMWMMKEPQPLPNLATSWEWSDDGKTLTMHLVEGAKWSDGAPFTAEDIAFTYNDYVLNPNIPSWTNESTWTFNGEVTELEVVDKYTIKWHFGVANPVQIFYRMDDGHFPIAPKHIYKKYHPEYNPDSTYDDLLNSTPPEDLPPVVLGPYVPVKYKPGQMLIMERNPYYWQVDEDGNQLPYLDEVWFYEANEGKTRTLNVISGKGDRSNIENPQSFPLIKKASTKEDAEFSIRFGPFNTSYWLFMNFSKYTGPDTDRHKELVKLFRNFKFRKAISHAIDRDGIANSAFPGPMTKAWYGGYASGSPYYDDSVVTRYTYDPEKSRELLGDLGFEDTDDNGILNWPADSPLAGQDLIIEMIVGEGYESCVDATEALSSLFRKIGIDTRMKIFKGTTLTDRINAGNWEFIVDPLQRPTPFVYMETYGPSDLMSPDWHMAGSGGKRDLLDFEQEIASLMDEAKTCTSETRRKEIFREILRLHTENLYTMGIYETRMGLALNNRFRNVQPDVPVFLYCWLPENIPFHIIWVPEELQKSPQYTDSIPVYE